MGEKDSASKPTYILFFTFISRDCLADRVHMYLFVFVFVVVFLLFFVVFYHCFVNVDCILDLSFDCFH